MAITYSSHSPNGLLGLGFSLQGLSAITRCSRTYAQDGVRGSVNYDLNDRFCLDGQRLVPVSGSYTNYGADGEEYRTELDSFTQIFSHGTTGNGPTYFTAKTKSGLTETFGNTPTSGVVASGISSIRAWALSQVMDSASNYYTVTYTDDANGAYYPNVISYTGNGSISPQNSITFGWVARTDKIYSWTNGSNVTIVNRLANIQIANGSTAVRQYNLAYDNGAAGGASRLLSVQECSGTGTSGNAASTQPCMPLIPITWNAAGNQSGNFTYIGSYTVPSVTCSPGNTIAADFLGLGYAQLLCNSSASTPGKYLVLKSNPDGSYSGTGLWPASGTFCASGVINNADFNGDGKQDLSCTTSGSTLVATSNGDGTFTQGNAWPANNGTWCPGTQTLSGDFDGDGRSDLLCIYVSGSNTRVSVAFSNGDTTFHSGAGWPSAGGWCTASEIYTGDANGDGKTDLYCLNTATGVVNVALSNGDGSFVGGANFPSTGPWCAGGKMFLGDFNGDGKTDILCADSTNHLTIALSLGNGQFTSPIIALAGNTAWCSMNNVAVGDFNGDGKTDVMCNSTGGSDFLHAIAYSVGDGTLTSPTAGWTNWCGTAGLITIADLNGDGFADMACLDSSIIYTATAIDGPDLITSIGNGVGATVSPTYLPLTNASVYTKDSGGNAATYPQQDTVGPYYVVSSVARSNGVGGTLTTNYAYGGLKVDLSGRGSLGFRTVSSTDTQTSIVSSTIYSQVFPYVGLPATASTTLSGSGSSGLLKSVSSNYQCINPASSSACTIAIGNRYFPALLNTTTRSYDLNGAPLPTSTTAFAFDTFGNATNIAATSSDGFGKTTLNTYNNDTVHWWIGQLTESQVTATTP